MSGTDGAEMQHILREEHSSAAPVDTSAAGQAAEEAHVPRTISGKRMTAAALQRQREYMDWQLTLPEPEGDVPGPDDSWVAFMAVRRSQQETERSQDRAFQRLTDRWQQRGQAPPAVLDSRARVQLQWEAYCERNGWPDHAVNDQEMRASFVTNRRKKKERTRLRKITELRQAARAAAEPQSSGRKRGRPAKTADQRAAALEKTHDLEIAKAGRHSVEMQRTWFAAAGQPGKMSGQGRLDHHWRRKEPRGWPAAVYWWSRKAESFGVPWNARGLSFVPKRAAAGALLRAAHTKADAAMAAFEAAAAAEEVQAAAQAASARAEAAAADAVTIAGAACSAEAVYNAKKQHGRECDEDSFLAEFDKVVAAEGISDVAAARLALARPAEWALRAPPGCERVWSTEGQCEGMTRLGERCRVHRKSEHADAAPLRRGERFCRHHDPKKYTGVQCKGMRKNGKGRCQVWSGSPYAEAAPLHRGSLFCHHHRVRCAGHSRFGEPCRVTSSCEHAHAEPLRRGGEYCAHHCEADEFGPLDVVSESRSEQAVSDAESDTFSMALGRADEAGAFSMSSSDEDESDASDLCDD